MTPKEHRAAVIDWWAQRDERLRDPNGWLTLVGLHVLAALYHYFWRRDRVLQRMLPGG